MDWRICCGRSLSCETYGSTVLLKSAASTAVLITGSDMVNVIYYSSVSNLKSEQVEESRSGLQFYQRMAR